MALTFCLNIKVGSFVCKNAKNITVECVSKLEKKKC